VNQGGIKAMPENEADKLCEELFNLYHDLEYD